MNSALMEKAKVLAARNYSLSVYREDAAAGEVMFLAKNPELYGCMAQGSSLEDAIRNLEEARIDYITSLLEDGLFVPDPALELVAPEATLTDDTDLPAQFTVLTQTVPFDKGLLSSGQVAERKPLYEASLTS